MTLAYLEAAYVAGCLILSVNATCRGLGWPLPFTF